MSTFVPFRASMTLFTASSTLVCSSFTVTGTKRGSAPSDMAVAVPTGTRHLHHTLTTAGIVCRHAGERPHTGFIEEPTHTNLKRVLWLRNLFFPSRDGDLFLLTRGLTASRKISNADQALNTSLAGEELLFPMPLPSECDPDVQSKCLSLAHKRLFFCLKQHLTFACATFAQMDFPLSPKKIPDFCWLRLQQVSIKKPDHRTEVDLTCPPSLPPPFSLSVFLSYCQADSPLSAVVFSPVGLDNWVI